MPKERSKAEKIVALLRQIEVLASRRNTFLGLSLFVSVRAAIFVLLVGNATAASDFSYTFELALGSRVAFEGDSLIYGQDETQAGRRPAINGAEQGRSVSPLPEHLSELLQHKVQIENRGFPGDRTTDGLERWRHAADVALVFIMYGTNDAMNFGGRCSGILTLSDYVTNLKELVDRHRAVGAKVVLMTTPPIGVPEWDSRVSPYRAEARRVARQLDIPILDTSEVLSGIADKWVDGLHLNRPALELLAQFLSNHIQITPSKEHVHAP
jgi:lysophospholipase L1-like esterase